MKDYKRLTDRGIAEMLRNTEEESWDSDNLEAQCYIRLAELEDRIEDGALVELSKIVDCSKIEYISCFDEVVFQKRRMPETAVEENRKEIFINYGRQEAYKDGYLKGVEDTNRRAEVAERALREFAVQVGCRSCPYRGRCGISNPSAENDYQECYEAALRITEKELAEEKKDE